jgi:hypothetical protein
MQIENAKLCRDREDIDRLHSTKEAALQDEIRNLAVQLSCGASGPSQNDPKMQHEM